MHKTWEVNVDNFGHYGSLRGKREGEFENQITL